MAILTYNGLQFNAWLTQTVDQQMVYDQSDTDLMFTKITISGQAILSSPLQPQKGQDPASALIQTRYQFMQPRKALSFKINGQEIIPQVVTTKVDDDNGPHPRRFVPRGPLTEKSWIVDIAIESSWAEVSANTDRGQILSHRWTEDVHIDQQKMSTLTRNGRLRISSTFTSAIEDLLETTIAYAIPKGFVRTSMKRTRSESGLELNYTIVDEEKQRMPPKPATWADGDYAETCQMGAVRYATMSVRLKGPKEANADQGKLMEVAARICLDKARRTGQLGKGGLPFIRFSSFRERVYDNEVHCSMQWLVRPRQKVSAGNMGLFSNFGFPPLGSEQRTPSPDPGTRGSAGIRTIASPYQNPTLSQSMTKDTRQLTVQNGTLPEGQIPGG